MSPQMAALLADQEQAECAAVDLTAHKAFGQDEREWEPAEKAVYLDAITRVHLAFHPERRAA
jgi:hypothetical protein